MMSHYPFYEISPLNTQEGLFCVLCVCLCVCLYKRKSVVCHKSDWMDMRHTITHGRQPSRRCAFVTLSSLAVVAKRRWISPQQISSVLYSLCETAKTVLIHSAHPRVSDTVTLLQKHFANNPLLYPSIQDEKKELHCKALVVIFFWLKKIVFYTLECSRGKNIEI